jgi:hypothetical protein
MSVITSLVNPEPKTKTRKLFTVQCLFLDLQFSKPGRLPDGVLPTLQNGKKVTDYVWDPFDNSRLAACEFTLVIFILTVVLSYDWYLKTWKVPEFE